MFRALRLQKLVSCHVRGGEKRKCVSNTVLTLSQSQPANYKNPTATSPALSSSLPLSLMPFHLSSLSVAPYMHFNFVNKPPLR